MTVGEAFRLPIMQQNRDGKPVPYASGRIAYHSTEYSGIVTWRAAASRPYSGCAKSLPGAAQESRITHQPGAPLSAGTARQITIYQTA